jgi:hypothetical protein
MFQFTGEWKLIYEDKDCSFVETGVCSHVERNKHVSVPPSLLNNIPMCQQANNRYASK